MNQCNKHFEYMTKGRTHLFVISFEFRLNFIWILTFEWVLCLFFHWIAVNRWCDGIRRRTLTNDCNKHVIAMYVAISRDKNLMKNHWSLSCSKIHWGHHICRWKPLNHMRSWSKQPINCIDIALNSATTIISPLIDADENMLCYVM